jgi:hypothetical protein
MKLGDKYECDYLPGSSLTITKIYNRKMAVVSVEPEQKGHRNIVITKDHYNGPRLLLSHVFKGTELKRKEKLHDYS